MKLKKIVVRIIFTFIALLTLLSCIKKKSETTIPVLVICCYEKDIDNVLALAWLEKSDIIDIAGIIITNIDDTLKTNKITVIRYDSQIDSIFFTHSASLRLLILAPATPITQYLRNSPEQIGRIHSIYIQNDSLYNVANDSLLNLADIIPKYVIGKEAALELPMLKSDFDYLGRHSQTGKYLWQLSQSADSSYIITYPHALLTAISIEMPQFFNRPQMNSLQNHARLKRIIVTRL